MRKFFSLGGSASGALGVLLLTGCGSSPPKKPIPPKLIPLKAVDPRNQTVQAILLRLNRAQVDWQVFMKDLPNQEARAKVEKIERFIRDLTSRHLNELLRVLTTGSETFRAIAAFGVGWPRHPEAIQPLINALRDPSPSVVCNACLGLYVLDLPEIPAGPLGEVALNHKDPDARSNAALALSALAALPGKADEVRPILRKLLGSEDARVRVHALRGYLRISREEDLPDLLPLLHDPVPLVRTAAVLAVGHVGGPKVVAPLIGLLSPGETNENVRLYARKVLQRLSGGKDAGYDVEAWKKIFADTLRPTSRT